MQQQLYRMAIFGQTKVGLLCTRNTRGSKMDCNNFSARIIVWLKSTPYISVSGLNSLIFSTHRTGFYIAYFTRWDYYYVTYGAKSASAFFLCLFISQFSSTLKLMTVGTPSSLIQFLRSLLAYENPSIKSYFYEFLAKSYLKWAITFLAGSS